MLSNEADGDFFIRTLHLWDHRRLCKLGSFPPPNLHWDSYSGPEDDGEDDNAERVRRSWSREEKVADQVGGGQKDV